MSKPKVEVDDKGYFKDIHFLYEIINNLKNVKELKIFLKDILTSSELRMLKRRWHIASLLIQGLEIREVARLSKTSTATVSKVKKILEEGKGGLKLAVERSKAAEMKERKRYLESKRPRRGSKYVKDWFRF